MSSISSPDNSVLLAVGGLGDQYNLWAIVEGVKFCMEESKAFEIAGNAEDGCTLGQIRELADSLMQRSASNLTAVILAHGNMFDGTHKVVLSEGNTRPTSEIFECLTEVAAQHNRLVDIVLSTCHASQLVEETERSRLPPGSTVLFLGDRDGTVERERITSALGWAKRLTQHSDYTASSLLNVLLHAGFHIGELAPVYGTSGGDIVDLCAASQTPDQALTESKRALWQPLEKSMEAEYNDYRCHRNWTRYDMNNALPLAWTKAVLDDRRQTGERQAI